MKSQSEALLTTAAARAWGRLGVHRRAGVAAPLFSLWTRHSIGVGEIPDLVPFARWMNEAGLSLLQLLPLNDVGNDFMPYSSQSSFALDPLYLSLERLWGVDPRPWGDDMAELRRRFPTSTARVNYGVKAAKEALLRRQFNSRRWAGVDRFEAFQRRARYWLRDYALFRVLKKEFQGRSWTEWEPSLRDRHPDALERVATHQASDLLFESWLQWQLYEQCVDVRVRLAEMGVQVMGDLPFLVSGDSADVWAHPQYFKRHLASGAPPDMYVAQGQRWGMPAYDWEAMALHGYDYLVEKIRAAEVLYGLYRVDHMIGVFRLYTIPVSQPLTDGGLYGAYDPPEERDWEAHGRRLLEAMLGASPLLPCGEDLGVVPACSDRVLAEMGIPGLDVVRWKRDWQSGTFLPAENYRLNAVAVLSTHDTSTAWGWWVEEAGTVDEALVIQRCPSRGLDPAFVVSQIFDLVHSSSGRLRFRSDITTEEDLAWRLGRPAAHLKDFLEWFRQSTQEQPSYAQRVGSSLKSRQPSWVSDSLDFVLNTPSVFSIQLLQDWLDLNHALPGAPAEVRINVPGTVGAENWSWRMPFAVEELAFRADTPGIRKKVVASGRLP